MTKARNEAFPAPHTGLSLPHISRCFPQATSAAIWRSSLSVIVAFPDRTGGSSNSDSWMSGAKCNRFMIWVIRGCVTCARRASSVWSAISPSRSRRSKRIGQPTPTSSRAVRRDSLDVVSLAGQYNAASGRAGPAVEFHSCLARCVTRRRSVPASEAQFFLHLGVDAAEYFRALHAGWDKLRDEFGDAETPINPAPDYFIMTVHPPRMDRDGHVEFTLTDDARCGLEREAARAHGIKGIRLPAEARRRGQQ